MKNRDTNHPRGNTVGGTDVHSMPIRLAQVIWISPDSDAPDRPRTSSNDIRARGGGHEDAMDQQQDHKTGILSLLAPGSVPGGGRQAVSSDAAGTPTGSGANPSCAGSCPRGLTCVNRIGIVLTMKVSSPFFIDTLLPPVLGNCL